jgi:hypothetical protein
MDWYNGWSPKARCAVMPAQREAIANGSIPSPTTCSICGLTPKPEARSKIGLHDENYAEPLSAYHVCRSCHMTLHKRFNQPEPWLALVARHGSGDRWFEKLTMDPASLRRPFEQTYPNGLSRD